MLQDEIKEYLQPDGLVSPKRNPEVDSTGNGILYLSLYIDLLCRRVEITADDRRAFRAAVAPCLKEGLLFRSKTKTDQEGIDDYIALTGATAAWDTTFARRILEYGKAHHWIYNNEAPGKFSLSAWFGRFPHVIAHFYRCAGEDPGFALSGAGSIWMHASKPSYLTHFMGDTRAFDMKAALAKELGEAHPIVRYWV